MHFKKVVAAICITAMSVVTVSGLGLIQSGRLEWHSLSSDWSYPASWNGKSFGIGEIHYQWDKGGALGADKINAKVSSVSGDVLIRSEIRIIDENGRLHAHLSNFMDGIYIKDHIVSNDLWTATQSTFTKYSINKNDTDWIQFKGK